MPGGACFRNRNNPKGFYNQEWGHRYILNLLPNETYTRYYTRRDGGANPLPADAKDWKNDPNQFVTNPGVKSFGGDPESVNGRYRIRGLGQWVFCPDLSANGYQREICSQKNIAAAGGGLAPAKAGETAEIIYKVNSANATCSLAGAAGFTLKSPDDTAKVSISTTNGREWKQVWAPQAGQSDAAFNVRDEVNGLYETLVRIEFCAKSAPQDAVLKSLRLTTLTQINTKTNPALNFGKNTVYVAAGEQSESIVYWPDLAGDAWKPYASEALNIATTAGSGYGDGVMYPKQSGQDGVVVFRMDAPDDIGSITYGGRFAVLANDSKVEISHSFDDGKTWTKTWTLAGEQSDVVHYETAAKIPAGVRSVLYKYAMGRNGDRRPSASLYAVRMEAHHAPAAQAAGPLEVTFACKERQEHFTLRPRSHTQLVDKLPCKYEIDVGGCDHPVMESLTVNLAGARSSTQPAAAGGQGYSDGKDAGGTKYVGKFVTYGKNLAVGRPYTMSVANDPQWSVKCDPMKILTDGVVGANSANGGGIGWRDGQTPEIVIDLGEPKACGAFRAHVTCGWPWWNAMAGEIQDRIEVLTSADGKDFSSQGEFNLKPRFKDLAVNYMLADDESAAGFNFNLPLDKPVQARYVKFRLTAKRIVQLTELQVLDGMETKPFDMRLLLPDSGAKVAKPAN